MTKAAPENAVTGRNSLLSFPVAVQRRSDEEAANIDRQVNFKLVELLRQIRQSGVPIVKQASDDLNDMLKDFGSNIQ